jgi:hypothetical protein
MNFSCGSPGCGVERLITLEALHTSTVINGSLSRGTVSEVTNTPAEKHPHISAAPAADSTFTANLNTPEACTRDGE